MRPPSPAALCIAASLLITIACPSAQAQEKTTAPASSSMKKTVSVAPASKAPTTKPLAPAEIRSKLGFLAGSFMTEIIVPPGPMAPQGGNGQGTSVMAWALDSMFLILDDQSQNPLLGNYKAHGVLGYDVSSQQFILSIFNNSGDRPIYKGGFTGDTLVLITHVPMPKRPFDQKILWYKSGSAVKLQILLDSGKGYALVIDETETPMPPPIK